MSYATLADVPRLTRAAPYKVDIPWDYIESWLANMEHTLTVDLLPDFQRGHVWTEAQQARYVEFRLRGGESGAEILWNCPTWRDGNGGALQIVDGLQRLTAVRRFMADNLRVFGKTISEYPDASRRLSITGPMMRFYVNDLKTRAEVLTWYLELNAGGTPHAPTEIERVRGLLEAEKTP